MAELLSIYIPPGSSLLVHTEDNEFVISNKDGRWKLDGSAEKVIILKETRGTAAVVSSVLNYEVEVAPQPAPEPPPTVAPTPPPAPPPPLPRPQPLVSSLSLDEMIRRATIPGPTPAEEIIRATGTPPAPPPPASGHIVSSAVFAAPEAVAPAAPPPPALRPMDKASRDGDYIILSSNGNEVAAKWSSSFGRQFWVDETGDSLGFDNDFDGWRVVTDRDREEFNL